MSIRPGTRLGIDVGTVRIGVARCDMYAMLAIPLGTVARGSAQGGNSPGRTAPGSTAPGSTAAVAEVVKLANECEAIEVIVGLPLALSGSRTASTQDAVDFAEQIAALTSIPVRLVDERLSTVSAQRALHSTGRNARSSRPVIDQVAATIILQHALDVERSSGRPPGELITVDKG